MVLLPDRVAEMLVASADWALRLGAIDRYRTLRHYEARPLEEIRSLQRAKLARLLKHCRENVPYYRTRIPENAASGRVDFERLEDLPLLSKEDVRDLFQSVQVQIGRPTSGLRWKLNSTGGSTGTPVRLYQDENYLSWTRAAGYYFRGYCGLRPGQRYFSLWGSEREFREVTTPMWQRVSNTIHGRILLPGFHLTPDKLRAFVDLINRHPEIDVLSGYSESVYTLARYVKATRADVRRVDWIQACAGTLYGAVRETIREVFEGTVLNFYGSRDGGAIASECPAGEGLHVAMPTHYVEVVRPNGERCHEGERGEIVITHLENYAMPLIRYRTGDIGSMTARRCRCGRSYELLGHVEGRVSECLTAGDIDLSRHNGYIRK